MSYFKVNLILIIFVGLFYLNHPFAFSSEPGKGPKESKEELKHPSSLGSQGKEEKRVGTLKEPKSPVLSGEGRANFDLIDNAVIKIYFLKLSRIDALETILNYQREQSLELLRSKEPKQGFCSRMMCCKKRRPVLQEAWNIVDSLRDIYQPVIQSELDQFQMFNDPRMNRLLTTPSSTHEDAQFKLGFLKGLQNKQSALIKLVDERFRNLGRQMRTIQIPFSETISKLQAEQRDILKTAKGLLKKGDFHSIVLARAGTNIVSGMARQIDKLRAHQADSDTFIEVSKISSHFFDYQKEENELSQGILNSINYESSRNAMRIAGNRFDEMKSADLRPPQSASSTDPMPGAETEEKRSTRAKLLGEQVREERKDTVAVKERESKEEKRSITWKTPQVPIKELRKSSYLQTFRSIFDNRTSKNISQEELVAAWGAIPGCQAKFEGNGIGFYFNEYYLKNKDKGIRIFTIHKVHGTKSKEMYPALIDLTRKGLIRCGITIETLEDLSEAL